MINLKKALEAAEEKLYMNLGIASNQLTEAGNLTSKERENSFNVAEHAVTQVKEEALKNEKPNMTREEIGETLAEACVTVLQKMDVGEAIACIFLFKSYTALVGAEIPENSNEEKNNGDCNS